MRRNARLDRRASSPRPNASSTSATCARRARTSSGTVRCTIRLRRTRHGRRSSKTRNVRATRARSVRRLPHPDFQDLAERSYRRQIAHLKPDVAAYEKQKESDTEPRPSASAQHALIPASEAQVPKAVAEYGAHRPDDDAVDRLVSHLNHEYVAPLTQTRPDPAAQPAARRWARCRDYLHQRKEQALQQEDQARTLPYSRSITTSTPKRSARTVRSPTLTPSRARHRLVVVIVCTRERFLSPASTSHQVEVHGECDAGGSVRGARGREPQFLQFNSFFSHFP